jgi:hypothetical protein
MLSFNKKAFLKHRIMNSSQIWLLNNIINKFYLQAVGMLSHKSRLLYSVGQRFGAIIHKQLKATVASDVNPFYYQDILETEKKPDIPWKKLTGTLINHSNLYNVLFCKVCHTNWDINTCTWYYHTCQYILSVICENVWDTLTVKLSA